MATKERVIIESLFMIADKEGNDVPFTLNSAQAQLDTNLTGRDIIPKARQEGISSYVLARFAAKCLYRRNTRAVVISHDTKSTQRMLNKVHYYLNNIRGPKAIIKNSSKNELTFPKTGSMFYIGTAGSQAFGRGDTITDLHGSEVAYWPDPKKLLKGLFQAVPYNGEVFLESTGNGVGNYYHKAVKRAEANLSRYRLHFFSWATFPEYCLPLSEEEADNVLANLSEDTGEIKLVEEHGLSAGQIAWRREKLEELDWDLTSFDQEYPLLLDDCFQSSGSSIFSRVNFQYDIMWKKVSRELHALEGHPKPGMSYAVGVDVGAGVGKDNSVIEAVCIDTMEQVAEWVSNKIAPDVLAYKIDALGRHYNEAFVTVENNNHGIVTVGELRKIYPSRKIYKTAGKGVISITDLGKRTTVRSKPLIIGKLRKLLKQDLAIHSEGLRGELSTFIETEVGGLEAEEGCMDDRVMALAHCVSELEKAALVCAPISIPTVQVHDQFSMDTIIKELQTGGGGFPIRPQAATQ